MIFLISAIRTNSLKSGFKDGIPRLFGEKQFGAPNPDVTQGSPPPMRGKARGNNIGSHWIRITPAYAGKSMQQKEPACCRKDHPRLCGEKCSLSFPKVGRSGSPPPMRGKGVLCVYSYHGPGITPAYAGKSKHKSNY